MGTQNLCLGRTAVCLLILCLCFPPEYGEGAGSVTLYIKYLKVSGFQTQLKLIPKALFGSLPADAFGDPKTKNKVERSFYAKTDSDEWVSLVASELANGVDVSAVDELTRFYSSRVGRKLATAQEAALNSWTLQHAREGYSRVPTLSETRLSLLRKLVEDSDIERANIEAVDAVVQGLLEGYLGQSGKHEMTKEDMEETLLHSRRLAQARTGELCLVSLANSLSSFNDQELGELSSFFESNVSRQAQTVYRKALRNVLRDAGHALGEAMREISAIPSGGSAASR